MSSGEYAIVGQLSEMTRELRNIWGEVDETIEPLRVTATALVRIQAALDVSNILKIEELMREKDPLGWAHNVGDVMQVYANYRCNIDKHYVEAERKYLEGGHVNDEEKEEVV